MASIDITGIVLSLLSDPSDALTFNAGVKVTPLGGSRGEIRPLVSGRFRRIGRAGKSEGVNVNIPWIDRTEREALKAREGVMQMYRDGRGRLIFGVYEEANGPDIPGPGYGSVSFAFRKITYSIEV